MTIPSYIRRWTTTGRTPFVGAWCAASAALVLLLAWTRILHPAYLLVAAGASGAALLLGLRSTRGARGAAPARRPAAAALYAAVGVLVLGIVFGAGTERRLDRLAADWDELRAERESRRDAALERRLTVLITRGRRTTERAARRAAAQDTGDLSAELASLRGRADVAALAVVNGAGELTAWAGEHRGALPRAVRAARDGILYAERPLFTYLYFTTPVEGRDGHAVAALLLEAGVPRRQDAADGFAGRFEDRAGSRPRFGSGGATDAAWSLVQDADTVVHARFDPVTQAEWRADVTRRGRRVAAGAAALALALLTLAWARSRPRLRVVPLAVAAAAFAVAPLGAVSGLPRFFSPALFVLPGPGDVLLGTILAVALPVAALAATGRSQKTARRRERALVVAGAAAVALGFPAVVWLLLRGATPPLLLDARALWGALLPTAVLLLGTLAAVALPRGRDGGAGVRGLPIAAGLGLGLVLAVAVFTRWRIGQGLEPWLPALWAIPFALIALGLASHARRTGGLLRWLAAGWLAATAVLPHLWTAHAEARLAAAEREIATLGTHADPFVDYMLRQFAVEAMQRSARGEDDVELLYRAWVASGLARAGYPVHLAAWGPDLERRVELSLSGAAHGRRAAAPASSVLRSALERAQRGEQAIVDLSRAVPDVNEVLVAALPDGRLVSAVVPPRRSLDQAVVLAPFLGVPAAPESRLTLLPARGTEPPADGAVRWRRTERGWRSEAMVRYPEGNYHAHLAVRAPPAGVLFARGVLLLALHLALLTGLWWVGSVVRGDAPRPPGGWTVWFGSFRARVTLTLFGFFLLPTALFGAIAYRALAGEVTRSARLVAERAAEQAVGSFAESGGALARLAEQTGREVLYYYRGELAGASSPEAVDLGLYGAWMPPEVYRTLRGGEEPGAVEVRDVGGRPYLLAYRPLQAAGALAVPISLRNSDAAIRQQELAHLILFAVLMGAVLSLALSVVVGRTLVRPIGELQSAASAVGTGRLDVRLPERHGDEFGELFASFNRMVERLRRARAQELRTARVLAWGEMARQVAHEIKNPLTPIKLSVQHLLRAYRDRRGDYERILESNVDQILEEIEQLTEISRVFSRYGLPPEAAGPLQAVDVRDVVHEALTLYRAGDDAVEYRVSVPADLPAVSARTGELKEVLLNLIENAREAVRDGGTVEVSACRDGDRVELAVHDDGAGIPADALPRIFEPHFSTRSAGTGLGLAIVQRLVGSWGGGVAAESEPDRGTTVAVRMRIAADGTLEGTDDGGGSRSPPTAGSGS